MRILAGFESIVGGLVGAGQFVTAGLHEGGGEVIAAGLRRVADRLAPPRQHGVRQVHEAASAIQRLTGKSQHQVAMVLGSGYGELTSDLKEARSFPMASIPHMPVPRVTGHNPNFYSCPLAGGNVLVYGGRVHGYEGYNFDEVTFAVRAAIMAGAKIVVLTNAAGGVEHGPGSLVFILDHLIESPMSLFPTHAVEFGPRFLDPSQIWDGDLRGKIVGAASEVGLPVFGDGVYVWGHGPLYETPRYVDRMHVLFGATLFGMSTVPEALAAHAMGARVLAFSTVTNWAAGKNPAGQQQLSHEEVKDTLVQARRNVIGLIQVGLPIMVTEALR